MTEIPITQSHTNFLMLNKIYVCAQRRFYCRGVVCCILNQLKFLDQRLDKEMCSFCCEKGLDSSNVVKKVYACPGDLVNL